MVPSLVAFFLIDHHAAQGVAISVALADSTAGAITHARGGNVNYRVLVYLAGPAAVAAAIGAFLSDSLSGSTLRHLFAIFMIGIWLALFFGFVKNHIRPRLSSLGRHREASEESRTTSRYAQNGVEL